MTVVEPSLIYETDDYNIVSYQKNYYAIKRSRGSVNLTKPEQKNSTPKFTSFQEAKAHAYGNETNNSLHWENANSKSFLKRILKLLAIRERKVFVVGDTRLALNLCKALNDKRVEYEHVKKLYNCSHPTDGNIVAVCVDTASNKNFIMRFFRTSHNVAIIAKQTERYFKKNNLFLVSIPKAGTHLLFELANALGYTDGTWRDHGRYVSGEWRFLIGNNAHTTTDKFFIDSVANEIHGNRHHPFISSPVLFLFRNPLDILLSESDYYHKHGATLFASSIARYKSTEARIKYLMSHDCIIGSFEQRLSMYAKWLHFQNIVPLSYETLVGKAGGSSSYLKLETIWKIMILLEIDGNSADIGAKISREESNTFNVGRVFRSQSYDFQKSLSTEDKEAFTNLNEIFGYPRDLEAPCFSNINLQDINLRFEKEVQIDPQLIISDFFGRNIVRFKDTYFALPLQFGKFDPSIHSRQVIQSHSLEEIKFLIFKDVVK